MPIVHRFAGIGCAAANKPLSKPHGVMRHFMSLPKVANGRKTVTKEAPAISAQQSEKQNHRQEWRTRSIQMKTVYYQHLLCRPSGARCESSTFPTAYAGGLNNCAPEGA